MKLHAHFFSRNSWLLLNYFIFQFNSVESSVDQGWSWVIVVGVFGTSVLSLGFLQCLGIFFIDWQEDFEASAQAVGWSSSMSLVGFSCSGKSLTRRGGRSWSRYKVAEQLHGLRRSTTNLPLFWFLHNRMPVLVELTTGDKFNQEINVCPYSGLASSVISSYVACRWQAFFGGVVLATSLASAMWVEYLVHLYVIMIFVGKVF